MSGYIYHDKEETREPHIQNLVGDHGPLHVHVYRNGRLVVIFDLENRRPVKGRLSRQILRLIKELEEEGLL